MYGDNEETRILLDEKKFLNSEPGIPTAVVCSIEVSECKSSPGRSIYSHCNFAITTCQEVINLDFDTDTEDSYKRSLDKLNIMIEAATKFREVFITTRKMIVTVEKEIEKEEPKK